MDLGILKGILQGLVNYHFPNEEMEKLAKERAEICAACPEANPNHPFKLLLEGGKTEDIKGLGCNECGCLLSAKVRQLEKPCPLNKWE